MAIPTQKDKDQRYAPYAGGGGVQSSTIAAGSIGPTQLESTAVTPGSYIATNLTVDADGRITSASNGATSVFSKFDIDVPPTSATSQDDEFSTAGSLDVKWTQVNWSGLTSHDVNTTKPNSLWVSCPNHATGLFRAAMQAIPAGDFTIITKMWPMFPDAQFSRAGLLLANGVTNGAGTQIPFMVFYNTGVVPTTRMITGTYTNYSTGSSTEADKALEIGLSPIILRIRRSSTTYTFGYSLDGRTWYNTYTTAALGITPTHFGLFVDSVNGGAYELSFDFFRYSASATASFGGLVNVLKT